MGDPAEVFGPNGDDGALQYLLRRLEEVGLKSESSKSQCYVVNTDVIPPTIPRPFHITDPNLQAQVDEKEAAAMAAEQAARVAPAHRKEEAERKAEDARTAANDARRAVPEEHRAYGINSCGAALGDDAYVANFIQEEGDRVKTRIRATATSLTEESAQAGHRALHLSLQSRIDFLLSTHLPSETRDLASKVEGTLREARRQAYGTDLHCTTPMWNGQRDPTFTRDQSNLRIGNGGVGFRDTPERALNLNTM